jgi:hypothetical protein
LNRAIDVPLESLPRIDEYSVQIDAEPQVTWSALLPVIARSFGGSVSGRIARALGCEHTEAHGDPEETGATVPGFVVARAIVPDPVRAARCPPFCPLRARFLHRIDR